MIMNSNEFDDLVAQAKQIGKVLATLYEDVTGEELDLEGAIRHYPLIALGLALGAGALGGLWITRRARSQLPPPPQPKSQLDSTFDSLRSLGARFRQRSERTPGQEPVGPLDYLEQLLPGGVDKVREFLPEVTPEEATAVAQEWLDSFVEPKLKQGLDNLENRFGAFFRQQLQRLEDKEGPEEPPAPGV
jgi:hypothetical protein